MKNKLKLILAAASIAALAQWTPAFAQGNPPRPMTPGMMRPQMSPQPPASKADMSYAIGMNIGTSIKRANVDLDIDVLVGALKDVMAGRPAKLTDVQAQTAFRSFSMVARAKAEEGRHKLAAKNRAEGEAFLAENKKKDGIKTHAVTMHDGKTVEFQYKVITEGTGAMPKNNDVVSVNYRGTLLNGKEFDNSAKHGGPTKFPANRGVRGWIEALQMMKVGSKWELFLPADLAYGDGGSPSIEPGSTLHFDVELVSVEAPTGPSGPAKPLTSDIIRVPSTDELKKGAKVEVLKAADAEKRAQAEAQKPAANQ